MMSLSPHQILVQLSGLNRTAEKIIREALNNQFPPDSVKIAGSYATFYSPDGEKPWKDTPVVLVYASITNFEKVAGIFEHINDKLCDPDEFDRQVGECPLSDPLLIGHVSSLFYTADTLSVKV